MTLTRTEAVVLKSTDYSETSRIYKLYPLSHGLQSLIAKGVRRRGSRISGVLESFNHIEVLYYKRKNRSLFTLSQATSIETFNGLESDIHRFYRAAAIAEMVLRLGREEDQNREIFLLLVRSLRSFAKRPISTLGSRMISFMWGMLGPLGYAPGLSSCVVCGAAPTEGVSLSFSVNEGGLICRGCYEGRGGYVVQLSDRMLRLLSPERAGQLSGVSREEERTLLRISEAYVQYHVHDRKSLECWAFLKTLQV